MKKTLIYSLKVWLTTIVVGPVIMGIKIFTFYYGYDEDAWKCLYLTPEIGILYGILYFLAPWCVFSILCWYVLKRNSIIRQVKIYLSFISPLLTVAPFGFMDYRQLFTINTGFLAGFPPDLFWTITYVSLTVAGIWFYKLMPNSVPQASAPSAAA